MIRTSRAKLQSGSGPVTNSPATSGPPLNTTDGPSEARAEIAKAPSAKTGMRTRTPTTANTLRTMVLRSMFIVHSSLLSEDGSILAYLLLPSGVAGGREPMIRGQTVKRQPGNPLEPCQVSVIGDLTFEQAVVLLAPKTRG